MNWPCKNRPSGSSKPRRSDATPASSSEPLCVGDALSWGVAALVAAQVDSPRLDAELLLADVLHCDRARLQILWHDPLRAQESVQFTQLVQRRASREPLAYILGERPFYDITLQVSPDVLVPRPETEHLVEEALHWAKAQQRSLRIVDVGTGSGAIAIVLARHLPESQVLAVDVSSAALSVARENARCLNVGPTLSFRQADLLTDAEGRFDLVTANLPYVETDEIPTLMPEVTCYEPHLALDGGPGGLVLVERLLQQLPAHLAPGGLALLELDPREFATATALARQALPAATISSVPDLSGRERVLRIERRQEATA